MRRIGLVILVIAVTLGIVAPSGAYVRPGATEMVSVASDGSQARDLPTPDVFVGNSVRNSCGRTWGHHFDINANGRFVAFVSLAANLVPGDTNQACDIFVHDRQTGKTERVSLSWQGAEPRLGGTGRGFPDSISPSISATGRYIAFTSSAMDLVPGDTNLTDDIFVHDRMKGSTVRVSVASDGSETDAPPVGSGGERRSDQPSISADGKVVSFMSAAIDLVEGDTNNVYDVFVHGLSTGETRRVSVSSKGEQGSGQSWMATLSADGRFVAFRSDAAELVANDVNRSGDVFVHDMRSSKTELVSVGMSQLGGAEQFPLAYSDPWSYGGGRQISGDGRYVVWQTPRQDFVPNDTNFSAFADVFVHDRDTGRVRRVSVTATGGEGSGPNREPVISADGRYVLFQSASPNFSPAGTDTTSDSNDQALGISDRDIYLYDILTGSLEWISVAPDGTEASESRCTTTDRSSISFPGALSADGRYAAFISCAGNLVEGDGNDVWDVFVRDRGDELGVGGWVRRGDMDKQVSMQGRGELSRDGLILQEDEIQDVSDVVDAEGVDLLSAMVAVRPRYEDIFVRIELESMPRVTPLRASSSLPGPLYGLRFAVGGEFYEIRSQRVFGPSFDAEGGASFGLFRCKSPSRRSCVEVGAIRGGYGTTGQEIVLSVPLRLVGLSEGGEISTPEVYSALGSYLDGPLRLLDRLSFQAGV